MSDDRDSSGEEAADGARGADGGDRTGEPSGIDEGDAGDRLSSPGGGPRRVVSNESVDDILNTLNETKPSEPDDANGPLPNAASVETVSGADSIESPSPGPGTDAKSDSKGPDSDGGSTAETGTDSDPTVEAASEAIENGSTDRNADDERTDEETAADDERTGERTAADDSDRDDANVAESEPQKSTDETIEDAASAIDRDAALSARVETGEVTGADVRAAEAGEGREGTPDIDEIDLSLDDLEETRRTTGTTATPSESADPADGAGPLAGSIGPGADEGSDDRSPADAGADGRSPADGSDPDADDSSDESDESPGLLDRLKGLFSG